MKDKDFTGMCLEDAPDETGVEDLRAAFCSRCWNTECAYSQSTGWAWTDRMKRQKKALENPTFGDPNDPAFADRANQDFENVQGKEIDPWMAPSLMEQKPTDSKPSERTGRRIVHEAEPPTKNESSSAVDDASRALRGGSGAESEVDEVDEPSGVATETTNGQPDTKSQESVSNEQSDETSEVGQPSQDASKKYNTEPPENGLYLPGAPSPSENEKGPDTPKKAQSGRDKWSVEPEGSDEGSLKVRISDGKRVDS